MAMLLRSALRRSPAGLPPLLGAAVLPRQAPPLLGAAVLPHQAPPLLGADALPPLLGAAALPRQYHAPPPASSRLFTAGGRPPLLGAAVQRPAPPPAAASRPFSTGGDTKADGALQVATVDLEEKWKELFDLLDRIYSSRTPAEYEVTLHKIEELLGLFHSSEPGFEQEKQYTLTILREFLQEAKSNGWLNDDEKLTGPERFAASVVGLILAFPVYHITKFAVCHIVKFVYHLPAYLLL